MKLAEIFEALVEAEDFPLGDVSLIEPDSEVFYIGDWDREQRPGALFFVRMAEHLGTRRYWRRRDFIAVLYHAQHCAQRHAWFHKLQFVAR